jgi:hypothetical protein
VVAEVNDLVQRSAPVDTGDVGLKVSVDLSQFLVKSSDGVVLRGELPQFLDLLRRELERGGLSTLGVAR